MIHSRRAATVTIPWADISGRDDFQTDDRLLRMYKMEYQGEMNCALTRLPVSAITSGFYERQTNGVVHVSNLKQDSIPTMEQKIRGGVRPKIDVYWSPIAPGGGGYVCADDETTLAAYSKLNFTFVPCGVLRPRKVEASEASIWLEKRAKYVGLKKAVAPATRDDYASFAGPTLPPFSELLQFLMDKCKETRLSIRSFHQDNGSGVHYHQMLYAVLRRHERILDSICSEVDLGRAEHAEILTRVAYEGFLNFYIDWLSPEFFESRLQLLASIRSAQTGSNKTLDCHLDVLANFVSFLENTAEKGRVSPLGSFFHGLIYPPLSLATHRSYIYLEHEGTDFDDGNPHYPPARIEHLGRWLDLLTAALLVRVSNDVDFKATNN
jgi:hypothetical protein